jgi:hypothetical protein
MFTTPVLRASRTQTSYHTIQRLRVKRVPMRYLNSCNQAITLTPLAGVNKCYGDFSPTDISQAKKRL